MYINDDFNSNIEAEYLRKKISCNLNQKYVEFSKFMLAKEKVMSYKRAYKTESELNEQCLR